MEEDRKALEDAQLKCAINQFVWIHAPGQITMEMAESLACDIFYRFEDMRKQVAMSNIR